MDSTKLHIEVVSTVRLVSNQKSTAFASRLPKVRASA
jgi:hypothetical protein